MVRIFRHYVHRASLSSMLFDVALMILLALGAVTLQVGSLDLAVPLASGPVASYAACMMLLGSAAGLYDPASGAPFGRSVARVLAVLCVALPDGSIVAEARGHFEGWIGEAPRGSNGFGYDPLLVLTDGRTSAELTPEEKNARSHRGNALRTLARCLAPAAHLPRT